MTLSISKPQVAILSLNLKAAKNIGQVFKKLNIVPDTFTKVEDFLIAQIEKRFDLIIFDIEACIYEGKPLVLRSELKESKMAFYFSKESKELISPTYSINHIGYINSELDLIGQIRNLLIRYNDGAKFNQEFDYLKEFQVEFSPKQERLLRTNESLKEELFCNKEIFSIIKNFSVLSKSSLKIEDIVSKVFDQKDYITGYSLLELADGGTRLKACELEGEKRINVPSIWLGKKNLAIDDHAMEMTQNIVASLTSRPLISLCLSKDGITTDALLVLEIDDATLFAFDWEVVENFISGVYAQVNFSTQKAITSNTVKSTFDLLEKLKDENSKSHILAFDLSTIFDFKDLRPEISFNWALFWKDLRVNLANIISDGEIYTTSLEQVVLIVDNFIFDESFKASKEFCQRLSLRKYFEGLDAFEIQAVKIDVKEIAFSEFALLKHLENSRDRREANL